MRLQTMLRILETNVNKLSVKAEQVGQQGGAPPFFRIAGHRAYLTALSELGQIPTLGDHIGGAIRPGEFESPDPTIAISAEKWGSFQTGLAHFTVIARALLGCFQAILPPREPETVYVKLPPSDDLGAVVDAMKLFRLIIDQGTSAVLGANSNPAPKVRAFDTGSLWLVVQLGIAYPLIARIVWSAVLVLRSKKELEILDKRIEMLGAVNATIDDVRKLITARIDKTLQDEATGIFEAENASPDPERIGRLVNAIREMAELVEKGTQISPALPAPEEPRNLFPDLSKGIEGAVGDRPQLPPKKEP